METSTLAALVAIALIDSTSVGTLIIPLWLMLDPRRSAANVVLYLATLQGFYFVVGIALMLGARFAFEEIGDGMADFFATRQGGMVLSVVGGALIVASFALEPKRLQRRRGARGQVDQPSWSQRQTERSPRATSTAALALGAGVVEVATMLPYLAAIGIIATLDMPGPARTGVLGGYVIVMALPALVLLVLRHVAGPRVADRLERLRAWLAKHSAGTISILLLILGIHLVIRGVALVQ